MKEYFLSVEDIYKTLGRLSPAASVCRVSHGSFALRNFFVEKPQKIEIEMYWDSIGNNNQKMSI